MSRYAESMIKLHHTLYDEFVDFCKDEMKNIKIEHERGFNEFCDIYGVNQEDLYNDNDDIIFDMFNNIKMTDDYLLIENITWDGSPSDSILDEFSSKLTNEEKEDLFSYARVEEPVDSITCRGWCEPGPFPVVTIEDNTYGTECTSVKKGQLKIFIDAPYSDEKPEWE